MTDTETFHIDAKAVVLASHFVTKEESRPILQGVLFEPSGPRACTVATDGHRLLAVHCPLRNLMPERPVILAADWSRFASGLTVDTLIATLTEKSAVASRWLVRGFKKGGQEVLVMADEVEGPYPDWRNVIPPDDQRQPLATVAMNSEYVADFLKLGRILNRQNPTVCFEYTGDERAIIVRYAGHSEVFGMLMPVRAQKLFDGPFTRPPWLQGGAAVAPDDARKPTKQEETAAVGAVVQVAPAPPRVVVLDNEE